MALTQFCMRKKNLVFTNGYQTIMARADGAGVEEIERLVAGDII